ncbi:hypothetical protein BY458DRAFT_497212 [Sporodiniella umbellata]|nr:hypothetical protein BY458DRAFT_497212 [Sporodiniella umbellata]
MTHIEMNKTRRQMQKISVDRTLQLTLNYGSIENVQRKIKGHCIIFLFFFVGKCLETRLFCLFFFFGIGLTERTKVCVCVCVCVCVFFLLCYYYDYSVH